MRNGSFLHKEYEEEAESKNTLVSSLKRKDAPDGGTGTLQSM